MPGGIESDITVIQRAGGGGGAHASTHEDGGADEINVANLSGELTDPQPSKTHASDHQNGGADEISVAGLSGELAAGQKVKVNEVGKTKINQDFGASAARLRNVIVTPIAGEALRMTPVTSPSPFSGLINGNPTDTSVIYDGDTNEGMMQGIDSGAGFWGRVILHNTTRGTSRKVVEWNVATDTITTESTIDAWADNDVITLQSQTNAQAGYFDVDLSADVPATTDDVMIFATLDDLEGIYDADRFLIFHTYEAYNAGNRQYMHSRIADQANSLSFILKVVSQTITIYFGPGVVDVNFLFGVKGQIEYADT